VPAFVEDNEQGIVAVAFGVKIAGPTQVTVIPDGLLIPVRPTVPAKLKELATLTGTETPDCPMLKLIGGANEREKSPTWTVTQLEWRAVPGAAAPP
jgi:hypothetical protein